MKFHILLSIMMIAMMTTPALADDSQFFQPSYFGDLESYGNDMGDLQFNEFFSTIVVGMPSGGSVTIPDYWNIASDVKQISLMTESPKEYRFNLTTSRYVAFNVLVRQPIPNTTYTTTTQNNEITFTINYDKIENLTRDDGYIRNFICAYPIDRSEIDKKCLDVYVEEKKEVSRPDYVWLIAFLLFLGGFIAVIKDRKKKEKFNRRIRR